MKFFVCRQLPVSLVLQPPRDGSANDSRSGVARRALGRRLASITLASISSLLLALRAVPATADPSDASFAVEASAGPQASSRVDARVTRMVDGTRVTLPGAVVPALQPGDVVDIRFPDYQRPPARANYHVNAAFITEVAPQRWLFERSGPWDRLFHSQLADARQQAAVPPAPGLHFTYGTQDQRGIPIFFIVPEDGKTRGMDGVRDYVDAHPTDFKDMAQSANDAADRYVWFADFLSSLSNGSIDPVSGRQRVETIATSLGANSASVDACYAAGATSANVADCIKTQLNAISYQTNIEAPTQAQFFGGAFGAAAPLQIASYLVPLLSVWKLFVHTGHREFEYLPATLAIASHGLKVENDRELLMGLKVPSLRPPAAYSDALFFTIGDPQAAASPPTVVNAADPNGMCAAAARLHVPLHLDRTSAFVHDTHVVVTPDGGPAYTLPIDPRSVDAPIVNVSDLTGTADGAYTLRLAGRFGFDPIRQSAAIGARIDVPRSATWSIAALPHRHAIAGEALDFVASSAAAPCLSRAELQIGDQQPIALDLKRLSEQRIALHASLANVPPGDAHIRLYQADAIHDREIENDVAVAIETKPAHVDAAKIPVVHLGDRFIALNGSEFEAVSGLRFNGVMFAKDPASNATDACFTGPPIGSPGLEPGQTVSTQLITQDGSAGQVFVSQVGAPRPVLQTPSVDPDTPTHLSSQPLTITLTASAGELPARREIRIRRAVANVTPCSVDRAEASTYAVLPPSAGHELSASRFVVNLDAAQALDDRAFGSLQLQVADIAANSGTDWVTLPGDFVRAPRVSRIDCPTDTAAPCTLLGTGLRAIAGIQDDAGGLVRPGVDCVSTDKHLACLSVPRRTQYVLVLEDAHATMALPKALVTSPGAPGPPTSPAPILPAPASPSPPR